MPQMVPGMILGVRVGDTVGGVSFWQSSAGGGIQATGLPQLSPGHRALSAPGCLGQGLPGPPREGGMLEGKNRRQISSFQISFSIKTS